MARRKPLLVADLFCGAGGSSTGVRRALARRGLTMQLVAVNHWPVAIETHSRNHPDARHYCVDIEAARPDEIVPEGRLDLLMASPTCTFHSRARGGRPIHDQQRMDPWQIVKWCTHLQVKRLLIENVPEFVSWGPVDPHTHRPIKARQGAYFLAWKAALEAIGFEVDWRTLVAADYGDATTRERFFLIGRSDGKRIRWPKPTHSRIGGKDTSAFPTSLPAWRPAREIIDWSVEGKSIFDRKKSLAPNTIRRIEAGLRKYGGASAEPFLVVLRNHCDAVSIDSPVPTITANGTHIGLAQPEITPFAIGQQSGAAPRTVDDPLPTIATAGRISLIEPFITPFYGPKNGKPRCSRSVDEPLATIPTAPRFGLAEPVLVNLKGQSKARSIDEPTPTITARVRHLAIAEPCIIHVNHGDGDGDGTCERRAKSIDDPLPTVTCSRGMGLVEPYITPYYGTSLAVSVDEPLDTVTTKERFALVEPFVVPQFSERDGQAPRSHSIDNPLPTVTGHGAGALVEPVIELPSMEGQTGRLVRIGDELYRLDIRFRMLKNHELARAMGFDDDETTYEFSGNAEQITKQIGNAMPVNTAVALVASLMEN